MYSYVKRFTTAHVVSPLFPTLQLLQQIRIIILYLVNKAILAQSIYYMLSSYWNIATYAMFVREIKWIHDVILYIDKHFVLIVA